MPAFLVPIDPTGSPVPLEKTILLVGRQADCDIVLTHSRKISRKHCCFAQVNDRWMIRDLFSTNGVTVNGTRIAVETPLQVGDEVMIGDVRYQLNTRPQLSGAAAAAASANSSTSNSAPTKSASSATRRPREPQAAASEHSSIRTNRPSESK